MNILKLLEFRTCLALGRDYLTGAEIAKETLDKVSLEGFNVFNVKSTSRSKDGSIISQQTNLFMKKEDARDFMLGKSEQLLKGLPVHSEIVQLSSDYIEVVIAPDDRVKYTLEMKEVEVN